MYPAEKAKIFSAVIALQSGPGTKTPPAGLVYGAKVKTGAGWLPGTVFYTALGLAMALMTPEGAVSAAAKGAADAAEGRGTKLEEIVVTALRTPRPITAIPNTVRILDRTTVEEQLILSPSMQEGLGFVIPSYTGGPQKMSSLGESLRGRTPLYLVDGIPQSTPLRDGKRSAMTIDPDFIERIEVVYGANAIQGVGATGGVINYVTMHPAEDGSWSGRVTVQAETDDFQDDSFGYKTTGRVAKKWGAFDMVFGAVYQERGLYYDGTGQPLGVTLQGDTQDSRSFSLFSKLGVDVAPGQRVEVMANLFDLNGHGNYVRVTGDRDNGIPVTSIRGEEPGEAPHNEARNVALTYTHEDLGSGLLTVQGYYYNFDALYGGIITPTFQDAAIAPLGTLFDQSALHSTKHGLKVTYVRDDIFIPGLQLALGGDYLRDKTYQDLALTDRIWVPEMTFEEIAPFVQLEQRLLDDKLRFSGGLRYENVTLDVQDFTTLAFYGAHMVTGGAPSFDKALTNAGIVVTPSEGLSLFASFSQGFSMPDAGLVLRSVSLPNQSVETLIDLQPIVADNWELGVTYAGEAFNLSASYFWSGSDLGSRIQVIDGVGFVRREKTEIQGVEASANFRLPGEYVLGLNFAALRGRFDSDGDALTDTDLSGRNISPDRLNAFIEGPLYEGSQGALNGRLQTSHFFDRKFDGGSPDMDFTGYTLIDAILTWHINETNKVMLSARNLLNEFYITYYAQTGTTNNDYYFAGRGRSFTLRYQVDF